MLCVALDCQEAAHEKSDSYSKPERSMIGLPCALAVRQVAFCFGCVFSITTFVVSILVLFRAIVSRDNKWLGAIGTLGQSCG